MEAARAARALEAARSAGARVAERLAKASTAAVRVARETPLMRWERAHPTEAQLGMELMVVLLVGLSALVCVRPRHT